MTPEDLAAWVHRQWLPTGLAEIDPDDAYQVVRLTAKVSRAILALAERSEDTD